MFLVTKWIPESGRPRYEIPVGPVEEWVAHAALEIQDKSESSATFRQGVSQYLDYLYLYGLMIVQAFVRLRTDHQYTGPNQRPITIPAGTAAVIVASSLSTKAVWWTMLYFCLIISDLDFHISRTSGSQKGLKNGKDIELDLSSYIERLTTPLQ